jgi:glycosyltransferase involved in cell wall biosynthesis
MEALLSPASIWLATRISADSEFTRSELLTFYPRAEKKTEVIYLASCLMHERSPGGKPLAGPYFLFVGSNEPRKNVKRMLLAYLEYRASTTSPLDLAIVGTHKWGEFDAETFARENGLSECVHLIEKVNDADLSALYAHASALILVSLYEGFGLPLVEAMQWGIPIVASRNSSVGEIAGDAGLLVDPYDVGEIAQAFRCIAEDGAVREKLVRAGHERSHKFRWKEAAAATLALITADGS